MEPSGKRPQWFRKTAQTRHPRQEARSSQRQQVRITVITQLDQKTQKPHPQADQCHAQGQELILLTNKPIFISFFSI